MERFRLEILVIVGVLLTPGPAGAFTLDEAIDMARKRLPSFKATAIRVQSSDALYKASLSPYLPTLDLSGVEERRNVESDEFESRRFDATVSYLLFDGGRRRADRDIARLNLDSDREELRRTLILLEGDVKRSFYSVLARKEFVEQRQLQLQDARKDFEIAEGRFRAGAAKRSDVLQASVRLQEARLDLRQARGDLATALYALNSLVMRSLDAPYDLIGELRSKMVLPARERLVRAALGRPEVQQARNAIDVSASEKNRVESRFWPDLSLSLNYGVSDTDNTFGDGSIESKSAGLFARWNLFALDKFYQRRAAALEIGVSEELLDEEKRLRRLDVQTAYEDLITSYESLALAQQQLTDAQFNYQQALGEYKVGKGDILSLVRAESALADARRAMTVAKLQFALDRADLEQAAGVRDLASMQVVEVP